MKRLFTLLTTILTILTATAQVEHSIILDQNSFRAVQSDALTGVNIDKIADDTSRKPCARVKIKFANMSRSEVDALDVKFQSNTDLAKRKVAEYYDNVLILEMTAKPNTRFYVKSPDFGESNEVTLNLEAYKEYEMEASLNQSFSIVVNSNVEGAEVYIDNSLKGRTDNTNSCTIKNVMIGNHTLKLVYGAISTEQQIDVNSSNISFRQYLNVDIERFDVTLKVQPTVATIILDNNGLELPISNGIFSLKLAKGIHTYIVKADKHHSQSGEFNVTKANEEFNISLKKDAASITLSVANNAEIWVNSSKKGVGTWRGVLYSGFYTFEARKAGHRTTTLSQNITSDEPQQSYELSAPTPIFGLLNITSSPAGATIYLDDKSIGTTPLTLSEVLIGRHTIMLTMSGYQNYSHTASITEGATTSVNASLIVAPKYKIGDIVTINGVKGIVFQTSPNVKMVSLEEHYTTWGKYGATTKVTNKTDGKLNMLSIKYIKNWQKEYSAFQWCDNLGRGWYLPAIQELQALYNQKDAINKILREKGFAVLGSTHYNNCFWSSSESNSYDAFYFSFSRGKYDKSAKSYSSAIRAVYVIE